eukprot:TRINITY_DN3329_c0_g5_i1.p1 TRINITY_DN3329_c0_g5~~TRINITY_DN3329_c0_g5_i1.p1  ORF type:complete len:142 (+),score=13.01 TRINITY_DN3329_c0_g5_i1:294-719(+)
MLSINWRVLIVEGVQEILGVCDAVPPFSGKQSLFPTGLNVLQEEGDRWLERVWVTGAWLESFIVTGLESFLSVEIIRPGLTGGGGELVLSASPHSISNLLQLSLPVLCVDTTASFSLPLLFFPLLLLFRSRFTYRICRRTK